MSYYVKDAYGKKQPIEVLHWQIVSIGQYMPGHVSDARKPHSQAEAIIRYTGSWKDQPLHCTAVSNIFYDGETAGHEGTT